MSRGSIACATRRRVLGAMVLGAAAARVVRAEAWPSRPIRIVVPYTPGGSSDIIARAVAQPLSERLGVPVVVDNKPGANGNLGAGLVAKAPADGYTLLLCDAGALAISPSVYTRLGFDPSKDLRGVSMLAYSPHMLVVHPSVRAATLAELVQLSKTGQVNFAITAIGSAPHLAAVAVERATGARWTYVPYKGGSQALTDTVGGQTQAVMNGMLATLPYVQNGQLKVIGISRRTRMPLVGSMPTLAEQGMSGFESGTWQGVLLPAGAPPAVVTRLSGELTAIIRSPEVRSRLVAQGAEVATLAPDEFGRFFESERRRWAEVVREAGIRLD